MGAIVKHVRERPWVVIYHTRGVWPLRRSSWTDLQSWGRHAKVPVVYINAAFGLPLESLQSLAPSRILFDTSFLKLRWREPEYLSDPILLATLAKLDAVKILRPQDEFVDTDKVDDFASAIDAQLILSCAPDTEHQCLYPKAIAQNSTIHQVMTGYIDDDLKQRYINNAGPIATRPIDLGYRAWRATSWLGRHAKLKVDIADAVSRSKQAKQLSTDISLDSGDVVTGDAWLRLLERYKAVLGVEGGASIHDRDGSLRRAGLDYIALHPSADFETVEQAVFRGRDGAFDLKCLSPRHLEAAAVGTCQFLVRGDYNGALEANVHYVPIAPDLSDIDNALSAFDDLDQLQKMANRARQHVLTTPELSYDWLVRNVQKLSAKNSQMTPSTPSAMKLVAQLQRRDRQFWKRIRMEVWLASRPSHRRIASQVRVIFRAFLPVSWKAAD